MPRAIIVTGLQMGDEGKGATVDSLCRRYPINWVIRHCGGAQAGHNVTTQRIGRKGNSHTFAQFGSGTFSGVCTFLSEYMLVEPITMLKEAEALNKLGVRNFSYTYFDPKATVITPYHVLANRIKEMSRGKDFHGSCGLGIGECASDKNEGLQLTIKDLFTKNILDQKLDFFYKKKRKELMNNFDLESNQEIKALFDRFCSVELLKEICEKYTEFRQFVKTINAEQVFSKNGNLVFEGAQGVLIDEKYGFAPYNTWSNVTNDNALNLINTNDVDNKYEVVRLGLTRTYMTRHGPGPLVTEITNKERRSELLNNENNVFNEWQQKFRVGNLDLVALRYAINHIGGIDYLVVNHVDKLQDENLVCNSYINGSNKMRDFYCNHEEEQQYNLTKFLFDCKPNYDKIKSEDFPSFIEEQLNSKIAISSKGADYTSRKYLIDLTTELNPNAQLAQLIQ